MRARLVGCLAAVLLVPGCVGGDGAGQGPSTTLSEGGEQVPVGEAVLQEQLEKARAVAQELGERVGGTTPAGRPAQQSLALDDLPTVVTTCDLSDQDWPRFGEVTLTFDYADPHERLAALARELQDEGWSVRHTRGDGEAESSLTATRPDGSGVRLNGATRGGVSRGTFTAFTPCVAEDGSPAQ